MGLGCRRMRALWMGDKGFEGGKGRGIRSTRRFSAPMRASAWPKTGPEGRVGNATRPTDLSCGQDFSFFQRGEGVCVFGFSKLEPGPPARAVRQTCRRFCAHGLENGPAFFSSGFVRGGRGNGISWVEETGYRVKKKLRPTWSMGGARDRFV
jgi:hypothetical protein